MSLRRGRRALRQAIFDRVRRLDNVRQEVPRSYLAAKALLEATAKERKNLSRAEYETLCREQDIEAADQSALLAYLGQLGTLFHYQSPGDYGPLPDTYVLDPMWVTQGVYSILTDLELRRHGGELRPADVARIFQGDPAYPRTTNSSFSP